MCSNICKAGKISQPSNRFQTIDTVVILRISLSFYLSGLRGSISRIIKKKKFKNFNENPIL